MTSPHRVPAWATTGVLTLCGMVVSLQQTLIIPLLPDIPEILGVSADDASWLVTATLLTGAVATPIVSRMADMYGKRRMLLIALSVTTVGSFVAALSSGFALLIVGRAMQGFGSALIPVGISIMRDELPRDKLATGIALMSATLGIGAALGLPMSGLLYGTFGWTSLFWSTAAVGLLMTVSVRLLINESDQRTYGRFDILGALVLSVVLVAALLVLSKGTAWGWSSTRVIGLAAVSLIFLALWIPLQLRTPEPMVNLRTAVRAPVLLTNLSSFFAGSAMLVNALITTQELQVPAGTGYGLALPVVAAGLAMVPGGLVMLLFSPVASRMLMRWGGKPTLLIGSTVMGLTYVWRDLSADTVLNVILGTTVVSVGTAMAFAALPTLIMSAVPRSETAAANGLNTLSRSLGTSTGSAVLALVFASMTVEVDGAVFPSAMGISVALWFGAGVSLASIMIGAFIPIRSGGGGLPEEEAGEGQEPAPEPGQEEAGAENAPEAGAVSPDTPPETRTGRENGYRPRARAEPPAEGETVSRTGSREAIITAARALFAEHGYSSVTIRDIASTAGVSPALVIKHYGNKSELFNAVIPLDVPLVELDLPPAILGRALVQKALARREQDSSDPWLVATAHARELPDSAREAVRSQMLEGLSQMIGDTTPDRRYASAIACQMVGLTEGIRVLGMFPSEELAPEELLDLYAPLVQAQVDACSAAAGSERCPQEP